MGFSIEGEVFMIQEDQGAHILKQFQTQSGESTDFREGYDTAICEVHKQYNLRSTRIDIPETNKQKAPKQPIKGKTLTTLVHILSRLDPNPSNPIIEDVFEINQTINNPALLFLPREMWKNHQKLIKEKLLILIPLLIRRRT